jgi:polysaccharide deacetylase family protein (PEP-CTERM system associated)
LKKICLLTFDVEEWFQVENLKGAIQRSEWDTRRSSVERNSYKILNLLDKFNVPATFFVLGWIAEKNSGLIKDISRQGHEIACHGYGHDLANQLAFQKIYKDISGSKQLLENIIAHKVLGYRAPSFSINDQILNILKDLNFLYDSSFNPFKLNSRHGIIHKLGKKIAPGCYLTDSGLYELPLSNLYIYKVVIPLGGGAYFRIYPLWLFKPLVKYKLSGDPMYNFYLHPWEFEPEQEHIKNIKLNYRFRHYYGLKNTENKFEKFILYLKNIDCDFITMEQYIKRLI